MTDDNTAICRASARVKALREGKYSPGLRAGFVRMGCAQTIAVRSPWQRLKFARCTMAPDSG